LTLKQRSTACVRYEVSSTNRGAEE